jgi:hypothetical protein
MARSFHSLVLLAVGGILGTQAVAEPPPPDGGPGKRRLGPLEGAPSPSPEFENVRKALDALTPEQRKRFQENFWRWTNLSPDEKKALRDREELRRKILEQDVQVALQESGLQLEGDRKEQFVQRYSEERKKIEEQLRKETMEKRRPLVKDLIARLKTEFSGDAVAPGAPAKP